ncbi:MAG: hypothetical protein LBI75_12810 [Brucellaceae bacterium]|jgi:hypothetical protein|nr:hypothetical protein [Brucellaceae bacterium]
MRKYLFLSSKSKEFITITCIRDQSSYSNSNIGSIFFDHMDHHKRPSLNTNSPEHSESTAKRLANALYGQETGLAKNLKRFKRKYSLIWQFVIPAIKPRSETDRESGA